VERTGVLILRAWVEAGKQPALRVRIIQIIHGGIVEPMDSSSATIDGVCAEVRGWLQELEHGRRLLPSPDHGDTGTSPSATLG